MLIEVQPGVDVIREWGPFATLFFNGICILGAALIAYGRRGAASTNFEEWRKQHQIESDKRDATLSALLQIAAEQKQINRSGDRRLTLMEDELRERHHRG